MYRLKKIIKKSLNFFGYRLSKTKADEKYHTIYSKYKEFTMIPEDVYVENIKLCEFHSHIVGDIIECGTWKGGMIAGIAELLGDKNRTYYLFDSFEGLPTAKEIDGIAALDYQKNKQAANYYDNCKTDIKYAEEAMKLAKIKNVFFIKGWFDQTLPNFFSNEKIAILRLDGDWYDSIFICMEYLYPKVAKNGLIIIDDYYVWEGTTKAIHDYLSKIKSASKMRTLKGGVAYIIKED